LVRQRCLAKPNKDEALLSAMITEVRQATRQAKKSLAKGLDGCNTKK